MENDKKWIVVEEWFADEFNTQDEAIEAAKEMFANFRQKYYVCELTHYVRGRSNTKTIIEEVK